MVLEIDQEDIQPPPTNNLDVLSEIPAMWRVTVSPDLGEWVPIS